jgi:hypothetical protein
VTTKGGDRGNGGGSETAKMPTGLSAQATDRLDPRMPADSNPRLRSPPNPHPTPSSNSNPGRISGLTPIREQPYLAKFVDPFFFVP